mgnify:CR=1 FL=1
MHTARKSVHMNYFCVDSRLRILYRIQYECGKNTAVSVVLEKRPCGVPWIDGTGADGIPAGVGMV